MAWPHNTAPPRPFTPVESIPLERAQYCEDCKMVTCADNNHCRVCGSHSVLMLAKVMGK